VNRQTRQVHFSRTGEGWSPRKAEGRPRRRAERDISVALVEALPEKSRVEVLDGALIVNPSPLPIHRRIVRRLAAELERQLPGDWQLETDVDVMLSQDLLDYLSPDIVVFGAEVPLTTRPIPGAWKAWRAGRSSSRFTPSRHPRTVASTNPLECTEAG
jgi:Putative restriction endonuclease